MAEGPNHVRKELLYGWFKGMTPEQTVTLTLHATGAGKKATQQLLALGPGEYKGTCPVLVQARQGRRSHKRLTISHVDTVVAATG